MVKIGVLASGNGSNLQAIINACESGVISGAKVVIVLSNHRDAYCLERARKHNIEGIFVDPKEYENTEKYSQKLSELLKEKQVELVCLAGYLLKLGNSLIKQFENKIINIHPALLPKFGGKGMYGHHVHEAVLAAGEKESGCTVHFVNEIYDSGRIILQKKVPVYDNDTPDTLAKRILEQEHKAFPEAIKIVINNQF